MATGGRRDEGGGGPGNRLIAGSIAVSLLLNAAAVVAVSRDLGERPPLSHLVVVDVARSRAAGGRIIASRLPVRPVEKPPAARKPPPLRVRAPKPRPRRPENARADARPADSTRRRTEPPAAPPTVPPTPPRAKRERAAPAAVPNAGSRLALGATSVAGGVSVGGAGNTQAGASGAGLGGAEGSGTGQGAGAGEGPPTPERERAAPPPPPAAPPPKPPVPEPPKPAAPPVPHPAPPPAPEVRTPARVLPHDEPPYPRRARADRIEGTVVVAVTVGADGTPRDPRVQTSSGHRVLDDAAVQAVRGWRFVPARVGDNPVASDVLLRVRFRLE